MKLIKKYESFRDSKDKPEERKEGKKVDKKEKVPSVEKEPIKLAGWGTY